MQSTLLTQQHVVTVICTVFLAGRHTVFKWSGLCNVLLSPYKKEIILLRPIHTHDLMYVSDRLDVCQWQTWCMSVTDVCQAQTWRMSVTDVCQSQTWCMSVTDVCQSLMYVGHWCVSVTDLMYVSHRLDVQCMSATDLMCVSHRLDVY